MKTYYKVLCKISNSEELISVAGINDIELEYMPTVWRFPTIPNSKLFVFDTLENAKNCDFGTQIWECQVKNPSGIKAILDSNAYFTLAQAKAFWKSRKNKKKHPFLIPQMFVSAPKGTVICDAIKLTHFVCERLKRMK